ncbi:DUF1768-domain-containing protein [Daedalea quercina L-15889]|uniref:DUF1768-domain-containing protein n=1 Tax=Daedalea quercina L-15889 TaxID=1314783 RepID=A0A165LSA4_9APHY|nr:DUF1768-domain-containing protein [Daedalea quercina L-15889]
MNTLATPTDQCTPDQHPYAAHALSSTSFRDLSMSPDATDAIYTGAVVVARAATLCTISLALYEQMAWDQGQQTRPSRRQHHDSSKRVSTPGRRRLSRMDINASGHRGRPEVGDPGWSRRQTRGRSSSSPFGRPVAAPLNPTSSVLFYHRHEPYYEFTNFAPYPIRWNGHTYPSAEHLFQAHKFMTTRPDTADLIRQLPSPRAALEEAGRRRKQQRADWFEINVSVMDRILEAKFTQHSALRDLLLRTGNCELIEDSPVDSFWGWGHDHRGRNELGKALMRLRDKLRPSIRGNGVRLSRRRAY